MGAVIFIVLLLLFIYNNY